MWPNIKNIDMTYLHEVAAGNYTAVRTWAFETDLVLEVGYSTDRDEVMEWEVIRVGALRPTPHTGGDGCMTIWFDPADPFVVTIRDRLHKSDDFRQRLQDADDEDRAFQADDHRRALRSEAA